jgi:hypothetical protein
MAKNNATQSPFQSKVDAANARREALRAKGTANVLPTSYYAPTVEQAENLLVALIGDAHWTNEIAQEESSADTFYVFRKRNLAAGEQPTIVRCGYNIDVDDLVVTITGMGLPADFTLEDVKPQEAVTANKATAKRKAIAKADARRAAFQARLGF